MSEWTPYEWPELHDPDAWRKWADRTIRWLLDNMSQVQPEEIFGDDDEAIDGGALVPPLGGDMLPLDGGDMNRGLDGGGLGGGSPTEPQPDPNGIWKVIAPRIAAQTDVQKLKTTSTVQPGEIYRNVWLPTGISTPSVDTHGTLWRLPDGTEAFIPAVMSAVDTTAPVSPATLGSTDCSDETADTDTWDVNNQGANDGVQLIKGYRPVYNESGNEILYHMFRTETYNKYGLLVAVSAETRATVDTPEDC